MARRRRPLAAADREEAARLLGAGMSARAVARKFGCDHKTVTAITAAAAVGAQSAPVVRAGVAVGDVDAPDEFEAAQLRALEIVRAQIDGAEHDARGLAQLVKAQNDLIKAIRQHRLMRGPSASTEARDASAERVVARLLRLRDRQQPVVAASVEDVGRSDAEASGTDG